MLWVGDILVIIDNNVIHKLTGLRNEEKKLVNENNIKKLVETNLKRKSDGRNMRIDPITLIDVRVINKIIGYNMNHNYRVNSILARFIYAVYLMTKKK